jgi:hypothetical protein
VIGFVLGFLAAITLPTLQQPSWLQSSWGLHQMLHQFHLW